MPHQANNDANLSHYLTDPGFLHFKDLQFQICILSDLVPVPHFGIRLESDTSKG